MAEKLEIEEAIIYAATRYHVFLTIEKHVEAEEWRKTLLQLTEDYLWRIDAPRAASAAEEAR